VGFPPLCDFRPPSRFALSCFPFPCFWSKRRDAADGTWVSFANDVLQTAALPCLGRHSWRLGMGNKRRDGLLGLLVVFPVLGFGT